MTQRVTTVMIIGMMSTWFFTLMKARVSASLTGFPLKAAVRSSSSPIVERAAVSMFDSSFFCSCSSMFFLCRFSIGYFLTRMPVSISKKQILSMRIPTAIFSPFS